MLFQTVSTFLRFSLIPTPSPTFAASTAGNTRTWHVSDDKQEQFLTDALYMLDVQVRVPQHFPLLHLLVMLLVLCPRPNSSLSCAWLKSLSSMLESSTLTPNLSAQGEMKESSLLLFLFYYFLSYLWCMRLCLFYCVYVLIDAPEQHLTV